MGCANAKSSLQPAKIQHQEGGSGAEVSSSMSLHVFAGIYIKDPNKQAAELSPSTGSHVSQVAVDPGNQLLSPENSNGESPLSLSRRIMKRPKMVMPSMQTKAISYEEYRKAVKTASSREIHDEEYRLDTVREDPDE